VVAVERPSNSHPAFVRPAAEVAVDEEDGIDWLATYPNCWLCENGVGLGETVFGVVDKVLNGTVLALLKPGVLV
jgi:hypothetical protein